MPAGTLIAALWLVAGTAAAADLRAEVAEDVARSYYQAARLNGEELKPMTGVTLAEQLRAIDPRMRIDPPPDPKVLDRVRSVLRHAGLEISETRDGSILAQPLPGGAAEKAGLADGWLLRAVGTERVRRLDDVRAAFAALPPGAPLRLEVIAPELERIRSVSIAAPGGRGWDSPAGDERPAVVVARRSGVWHARIFRFQGGRTRTVLEAGLRAADGSGEPVVIDLRGNSGGAVFEAFVTAALLLPQGTSMGGLRPPVQDLGDVRARSSSPLIHFPIDVVIDRYTASAAEVFAAIMRDTGRGRIVGERSSGKCVVEVQMPLSGGSRLTLPVAEYIPPGGVRCHGDGVGIQPGVTLGAEILSDTGRLLAILSARSVP